LVFKGKSNLNWNMLEKFLLRQVLF
jgi:hypothetical protein